VRRGAYVAAVNRAKNALEEYNGADTNARSLKIMAEAYEKLGMHDLADDTRRVLAMNFPADTNARSLKIMAEAYEKLGMHDLADDTRRVLAMNFPTTK
jgi:outer membrane protein assembly factor BamD (BamD/ComL family)